MAILSAQDIHVGGWRREYLRADLTKAERWRSLEVIMTFFIRKYVRYNLRFGQQSRRLPLQTFHNHSASSQ